MKCFSMFTKTKEQKEKENQERFEWKKRFAIFPVSFRETSSGRDVWLWCEHYEVREIDRDSGLQWNFEYKFRGTSTGEKWVDVDCLI